MANLELVVFNDPKSVISESFRTLRTNIQFMNMNKNLKCLLVTSSFPGEGKSWVSSNLALVFAQLGKKVLLIDSDLRKGRLYKLFDIPSRPGLSNYLSEMSADESGDSDNVEKIINETDEPNLFIIPAGDFPPNPSELLISEQMKALVEQLKKKFDLVIIDGTPCQLVTDASILSRLADSTVIVAEYNKTKKEVLRKTVKSIKNVGGNIVGIVINKIPSSANGYYNNEYYYGESDDKNKSKKFWAKKDFKHAKKIFQKDEKELDFEALNNLIEIKENFDEKDKKEKVKKDDSKKETKTNEVKKKKMENKKKELIEENELIKEKNQLNSKESKEEDSKNSETKEVEVEEPKVTEEVNDDKTKEMEEADDNSKEIKEEILNKIDEYLNSKD